MAGARDRIVQSAEKHLSRGKLDSALKDYLRLLEQNPNDVFALNKSGDLCVRIGRPADAIGHFERIAEVYGKDGFFLKAIAIYKKINKIDPTRLDVYEKLADLYTRQGLTQDARSHYQTLAELHLKKNDIRAAIAAYGRMVALDPADLKVQARLAELHRVIGEIGPAVARYDAIAGMLQRRGAPEEALAFYRKALDLDPNDAVSRLQIGRTLLSAGDVASVVSLFETGPRTAESRVLLAEAHLARRDLASAAATAEEALQLDKDDQGARALLGRIRLEEGAPDAALEAVSPLIDVAVSLGDFPRALAHLQPILAAHPGHRAALEKMAGVREAQGDVSESVTARFALAREAEDRGDVAAASEHYRRLLAVDPTHADAASRLAQLVRVAPPPPAEAVSAHPSVVRDDATAAREEAEVLSRYGLKDRAVERLRALLKRHPELLDARERLVELMIELENPAAAREAEALAAAYREQGSENLAVALFSRLGLSSAPPPREISRPSAGAPRIEFDEFDIDLPTAASPRGISELAAFDPFAGAAETLPLQPAARPRDSGAVRLTPHGSADTGLLPTELGSVIGQRMQRASEETPPQRPHARAPAIDDENLFADERQFFNLAEELEKELAEETPPPAAPMLSAAQDDASLQDIFREFRKGVEQQLSAEDYETHYNLGIAYKEMDLLDEAIGEFQLASKSPALTIECCSLLGLCFLEKGMPQLAIKWYGKGLATPGIPEAQTAGLLYDLARVYQDTGDINLAYKTFLEVYGINTNYRDVVDRVRDLEAAKKNSRESVH